MFRYVFVFWLISGLLGCGSDEKSASQNTWNEEAVRKVLLTFAYGGHCSNEQISTWANMPARDAIQEMLTFDQTNEKLSPQQDTTTLQGGTLEALQGFWSSTHVDNPLPPVQSRRDRYGTFTTIQNTQEITLSNGNLQNTWIASINKRGLNPFRQKFGLFLTNYHMAVSTSKVRPPLIRKLYDSALDALANGESYQDVMALGSYSAAVAMQYGHRNNRYVINNNGERFVGNDDFAREFHQLFFRILGENEDPDYHENTTIEHTAWALTGMNIDKDSMAYGGGSIRAQDHWLDTITFTDHVDNNVDAAGNPRPRTINNLTNHHAADLEILGTPISGTTAKEKIISLAQVAIYNEESLNALPIFVVNYFADDNLTPEKELAIQNLWRNTEPKNILTFIQEYAISPLFLSKDTFKYRNAFNRNLTLFNLNTVDNEEAYSNSATPRSVMSRQGAVAFSPANDVFGGQNSIIAANNPDIFKDAFNQAVNGPWYVIRYLETVQDDTGADLYTWRKDWARLIPTSASGVYTVNDVGEWLWNRFIGDNLKNYGALERAYVNAFLATGYDLGYLLNANDPEYVITADDLRSDPLRSHITANEMAIMELDSNDAGFRQTANVNVGLAINFITMTPYMFAIGG